MRKIIGRTQSDLSVTAQALDEVQRILRDTFSEGAVTVYLFGSWARGNVTPTSDIDLAIEAHAPLPSGTLARLRERLEDSRVPYWVEIVDLADVDPAFRQRILQEGVRWNG